jgi:hypothetical protein
MIRPDPGRVNVVFLERSQRPKLAPRTCQLLVTLTWTDRSVTLGEPVFRSQAIHTSEFIEVSRHDDQALAAGVTSNL